MVYTQHLKTNLVNVRCFESLHTCMLVHRQGLLQSWPSAVFLPLSLLFLMYSLPFRDVSISQRAWQRQEVIDLQKEQHGALPEMSSCFIAIRVAVKHSLGRQLIYPTLFIYLLLTP